MADEIRIYQEGEYEVFFDTYNESFTLKNKNHDYVGRYSTLKAAKTSIKGRIRQKAAKVTPLNFVTESGRAGQITSVVTEGRGRGQYRVTWDTGVREQIYGADLVKDTRENLEFRIARIYNIAEKIEQIISLKKQASELTRQLNTLTKEEVKKYFHIEES